MFQRQLLNNIWKALVVTQVRQGGSCGLPPRCCKPKPCRPPCCCRCCPPEPRMKLSPCRCKWPPIPPNPCCPVYPKGSYRLYKYVFFFGGLPTIAFQMSRVFCGSGHTHLKEPCRDFEFMRRRTKNFPWGSQSFFHNEEVNHLPGECTIQPQPQDCE